MGKDVAVSAGFEARLDELWRCAFRAAYPVLRSIEETEDVAEEALIRAYAQWSAVEDHADAWVTRVAVNLAISTWRHEHRRTSMEARAASSDPGPRIPGPGVRSGVPAAGLDGRATDGDRLAVGDRTVARIDLLSNLATLSARQREVLAMRYLVDLADRDIAEALGCSTGAVKRHAARGLSRLRVQLGVDLGAGHSSDAAAVPRSDAPASRSGEIDAEPSASVGTAQDRGGAAGDGTEIEVDAVTGPARHDVGPGPQAAHPTGAASGASEAPGVAEAETPPPPGDGEPPAAGRHEAGGPASGHREWMSREETRDDH